MSLLPRIFGDLYTCGWRLVIQPDLVVWLETVSYLFPLWERRFRRILNTIPGSCQTPLIWVLGYHTIIQTLVQCKC